MDVSFIVGYVSFFILGAWLVNVKTENLFLASIIVRMSKGKRFLVGRLNYGKLYFVIGKLESNSLVYKKADKTAGRVDMNQDYVFNIMKTVPCVIVDDVKLNILKPDGNVVVGLDIATYENVYTRALTRPSTSELGGKVIKMILIAICGMLLFVVWKVLTIETVINSLGGL